MATERARAAAEATIQEMSPWLERAVRAGHAAHGIIYVVMGVLAVRAANGLTRPPTGPRGALGTLLDQPLGAVALGVLVVGVMYYALWELFRACCDPERVARRGGARFKRVGWLVSGLLHMSLAAALARTWVNGRRVQSDDAVARDSVTMILTAWPFGQGVLAAVGIGVVVTGVVFIVRAWRFSYDQHIDMSGFGPAARTWVSALCRVGSAARGVVLCLAGVFLVSAAIDADPREAISLGGALSVIGSQPYGLWLMGAVGAGLLSHGLYRLVTAWRGVFRLA
jgi:hypothetical protein